MVSVWLSNKRQLGVIPIGQPILIQDYILQV